MSASIAAVGQNVYIVVVQGVPEKVIFYVYMFTSLTVFRVPGKCYCTPVVPEYFFGSVFL